MHAGYYIRLGIVGVIVAAVFFSTASPLIKIASTVLLVGILFLAYKPDTKRRQTQKTRPSSQSVGHCSSCGFIPED